MRALNEGTTMRLDRNFEVPSIPLVLSRIIQVLDDDTTSAAEVERLIMHDPSLSARLLRLSNSAFYSFRSEVKTVSHAITLLGMNLVKSLAIGVSIFDSFTRGVKAEAEVISGLWMHSFSVAVVCQELWRRRTNKKEGEIAFLCGLLHDLGKVIFFKLDPKAYAGFFRHEEGAERARLCDFEVETFGLDHAEAGAKLAKVWGLPPELALAIGRHHKAAETDPPLVVAVALADQLVRSIKIGLEGDSVDQEELERLLTCLKCTEEECARLLESAERQKNYMEGFFILPVEPYRRPA